MFCPLCGEETHNALEQQQHDMTHTKEEWDLFEKEQMNRQNQIDSQQKIPVQTVFTKGLNYSKIYCTEWGISLTDIDVRIDIYNERIDHQPMINPLIAPGPFAKTEFIIENQLITPIVSAKSLHNKLGELITHYEAQKGKINLRNQ